MLQNNVWNIVSNKWQWEAKLRSDFVDEYRNMTGWDTNGKFANPLFVGASDLRLHEASPARNTGHNATCSNSDHSGAARLQESVCDPGAYEFRP
jgi:hypothetical protein